MRLTWQRALFLLALIALTVSSLRTMPFVDAAFGIVASPLRLCAELALPFDLLRGSSVQAAEESLRAHFADEDAERQKLFDDELRFAKPTSEALLASRSFVRGEIVRDPRHPDLCELVLESQSLAGIARGMPVVSGDVYVGRVVDAAGPGRVRVELATARGAFVGARALADDGSQAMRLVVGGVWGDARREGRPLLAVHDPERPQCFAGEVTVDDSASPLEPFARESLGFRLGRLVPAAGGEAFIDPPVDYKSGLFTLAIVGPAGVLQTAAARADELARPELWVDARVLNARDPSSRRAGLVVAAGTSDGVRPGAAAIFGARLVGRVLAASRWQAQVALLSDRGVLVLAIARLEGVERPAVLGALRSLGPGDRPGSVRLRWESPTPLAVAADTAGAADSVEALLFTGSGEPGVPASLLLGRARLPTRANDAVEIVLDQGFDGAALAEVRIRRAPGGEATP